MGVSTRDPNVTDYNAESQYSLVLPNAQRLCVTAILSGLEIVSAPFASCVALASGVVLSRTTATMMARVLIQPPP